MPDQMKQTAYYHVSDHLKDNPNRGLVQGLSQTGALIQICWIMGRSSNSRNRIFVTEGPDVSTQAADASKVEDPSLIIYKAMTSARNGNIHIVGNGVQVTTAQQWMDDDLDLPLEERFTGAMLQYCCEPDAPIFTPRVTGYVTAAEAPNPGRYVTRAVFSVVKADIFAKDKWQRVADENPCEAGEPQKDHTIRIAHASCLDHDAFPSIRDQFVRPLKKGYGFMITTYMPGRDALRSFQGEPLLVPLTGNLEGIAQTFWRHLESHGPGGYEDKDKVALAAKEITPEGARVYLINRL